MGARMADRPTLVFILATITLDAMGIGIIFPVMPDLIEEVRGVGLASAAIWGGILSAIFAVMQFLFSPVLGNLSDRYGRRPILLISLIVLAADYVVMALAQTIWVLILARVVAGITSATYTTIYAMVADIYDGPERSAKFGLIAAGFGIGFVAGPALGGLLGDLDPRAPFWGAALLALLNFGLGWVVLRETLARRHRRTFDIRRANPLGGLKAMEKLPGMRQLLLVILIYHVASWVYPAVWAYWTQARFGFDPGLVGLSLAAYGIGLFITQAFLIRPIIHRFGERRVIYGSLCLTIVTLIYLGLIREAWMLWAVLPLLALTDMTEPALQGLMSQRASADQQGELQGVQGSLQAIATIISPLVMTQIFWWFSREDASPYAPGAPFLFAALLIAGCLALFAFRPRRRASADAP